MDHLQAKHAIDQIEMHFEQIKADVLSRVGDPDREEYLEGKVCDLEEEVDGHEKRIEELEDAIQEAINALSKMSEFSQDDINEVIENLKCAKF